MDERESVSHTKWDCKYDVIFIPKYRRKTLYKGLRRYLREVFRQLGEQKGSRIEEGHLIVSTGIKGSQFHRFEGNQQSTELAVIHTTP